MTKQTKASQVFAVLVVIGLAAEIILSGFVPTENLTKRMFDDERFERQHNLMKAIDEINQKFGKDTVRFGNVKTAGNWKMKQTRKSPCYTTNWNELLIVN
jgi:DNA polymerase V